MADVPTFWFDQIARATAPLQARLAALEAAAGPHPYTAGQIAAAAAGGVIALYVVFCVIKHGRAIAALRKGTLPMSVNTDKVDAAAAELKDLLAKAAVNADALKKANSALKTSNDDLVAKLKAAAADDAKLVNTAVNLGALKTVAAGLAAPPG